MGQENFKYKLVKRSFDFSKHYAIIQQWWKEYKSFAPLQEHLSQNGFIIYLEEKPICAGFVYKTDSKICWFEQQISNPDTDKEVRDAALSLLIDTAIDWASSENFSLIFTSTNSAKFQSRLEKTGFVVVDNNQTHLFYKI